MRQNPRKNKKQIDSFINGADSKHTTDVVSPALKTTSAKSLRVTFSLDADTKKIIEELTLRSRKIKTSNSDIIKAAARMMQKITIDEFENALIEIK